jgi:hypothetical protein
MPRTPTGLGRRRYAADPGRAACRHLVAVGRTVLKAGGRRWTNGSSTTSRVWPRPAIAVGSWGPSVLRCFRRSVDGRWPRPGGKVWWLLAELAHRARNVSRAAAPPARQRLAPTTASRLTAHSIAAHKPTAHAALTRTVAASCAARGARSATSVNCRRSQPGFSANRVSRMPTAFPYSRVPSSPDASLDGVPARGRARFVPTSRL